jgi:signal transduction histidine kinase
LVLIGAALVWVAIRVIAQFRRLYNSQQAASLQLGQALQAKSDFIADASHELRTPLTVLRGNAEAGLAIDRTCAHREILEEIVSESARMTKLVEDLLFLARSDADSVPLDIESVAAEPILLELAERARMLVQGRGSSFTTRLDGYGTLNVDLARIEQAVMILIDNAANYSPSGGIVRLASSSWKNEFIIDVVDQGSGIRNEDIPRVFERFRRLDKAASRQRGGTGIGLAIAKTIVDAHHGRIEVHSRVGEGTQMRIYLPLAATARARALVKPVERPLELAP